MAEEDIEEIKKLPLAQRVAKLKELEEKKKKELDTTSDLLRQSLEQSRREKALENVEVPEAPEVDITRLFAPEDSELESVLAREAPKEADDDTVKYELQLDYQLLKKVEEHADYHDWEEAVTAVQGRVNEMVSRMDYANMSKDVANQLVATRSVLYSMKKRAGL